MLDKIILKDAMKICERANLDPLNGSAILVTGASGLIGTYILASLCCLQDHGAHMKVYAQHLSELPSQVIELISRGGFSPLRANLADFDSYERLPEVDVIIHAAGYAQPTRFMADPVATIQVNTSATIALLKRLRHNGRFLFVSSSEVCSGLDKRLLSENDIGLTTPSHPRAVYIEGKRCGEAICNAMRDKGMNAAIARVALA
ncbi:MAG TPA: NAD-dependent epimerase/dehydratase family protein, partial [Desulfatiglandales bacterium]|nr:NAD-dependent epimerase/dehydratase family protein [Desulfatiglandales bacterium]